ncbi:hypothetical protein ACFSBZ_00725 [Amnibacterium flavum]|uniref:Uncharacterized protein n=1 Tax=Amnibacterium flavum TaxID=2173173 RepID=A0A2V1HTY2_9MICO|nr:hypothetical protein [Amnibacterium flavum]PVZ93554.1 hypothetical protein DDQ50_14660 [Amnibacterium flavum]
MSGIATHPRHLPVNGIVVTTAIVAFTTAVLTLPWNSAASSTSAAVADTAGVVADGTIVDLAPIAAAWPDEYTVAGTKSEPLYVEHITSTRDGDVFALSIEVVAQGDTALGTQLSAVRVRDDGRIEWLAGCTKTASVCADDPALRGFLSAAAVRAAIDRGALPAAGVARTLHGTAAVCIADGALHPAAPPATTDLDPCFSRVSGALVGHYSDASGSFVGPTLSRGFSEATGADRDLIDSLIS